MPGGLYVLVAAMGSSILVRNRNIFLRATFPLAVGVAAGWYILPVTMGNVSELVWRYEKKFPVVADTHLRVKERVTRFIETGVAHSQMGVGMLEDKIGAVREKTEDWVKKGK
jgi:organizing structure protein 2